MKTLETKRLILRDWTDEDLGCGIHTDEIIKYLIKAKNNYAVVLKETGAVIGTIGLNEDAFWGVHLESVSCVATHELLCSATK